MLAGSEFAARKRSLAQRTSRPQPTIWKVTGDTDRPGVLDGVEMGCSVDMLKLVGDFGQSAAGSTVDKSLWAFQ